MCLARETLDPKRLLKMKEIRGKEIKIRLSKEEHEQLLARKTKPRLAEWIREIALDEKPKRAIKPVDPHLLYQLNKISTNINQIARRCNSQKSNIDLVSVAIHLSEIEAHLSRLIDYDC